MKTSDITLVFQGAFKPYVTRDRETFVRNISRSRKVLPGAQVILSTWEGADIPRNLPIDALVLSQDPGALAPLKFDDDKTKANNCNRQIVTSQAGLAAAGTPYAVKIRTDCFLEHAGFLDFHAEQLKRDDGRERLTACSFFTLDPSIFERLPYHLSDWFHFGPTALLQSYWSAQLLHPEHARFYETHPHPDGSTFFERKFRACFAVEQHICTQYAASLGYACPSFLNDVSDKVMRDYYRFLGREVMLLDPWQIGLMFNKYNWVGASSFQSMNNLMNLDWFALEDPELKGRSEGLRPMIEQRARKKASVRRSFHYSRMLHPILFDPQRKGVLVLRRAASRLLRYL